MTAYMTQLYQDTKKNQPITETIMKCLSGIATSEISLQNAKLRVYTADVSQLNDSTLFATGYRQVPPYRRKKIDSFLFQKDKNLSLGVELLFLKSLSDSGIPSDTIELEFFQNNKPRLKNYPGFYYNLSHSGTKVMCVTGNVPVGCDVEKISETSLLFAEKCFFNSEIIRIKAEPRGIKRDTLFYRYWTLKESFMKVTGLGMDLPLDAFEIVIEENKPIHVRQNVANDSIYLFAELPVSDGYCYSICSSSR